jgi:hypothetical protein
LTQVKVERERRKRADKRAKRDEKIKGLKAGRDWKKNPGDISNDIYVERNSVSALSSLSVTETESMKIDTADEEKRQVTFAHAIDIYVERDSASMEMSIVYNIFLGKNGLI